LALYSQVSASPVHERQIVHLGPFLATIFPNLHSLHLEFGFGRNPNNQWELINVTLNDLMSFRERPMEALVLTGYLALDDDPDDMVGIWLILQRQIERRGVCGAREILPLISCSVLSPRETMVVLPLKSLHCLRSSGVNEPICPLQHLKFEYVELSTKLYDMLQRVRTL